MSLIDFQNGFALGLVSNGKAKGGDVSSKEEQEKTVDIIENGTTEVLPDDGKVLSKVTVNVDVQSSGGAEELEQIIDESGVLDSTEGTVTKKVEKLVGKANDIKAFEGVPTARALFKSTKTFPSKATVNLSYATDVYQAFSYWNTDPIPIVEELTVNAPNIKVSNNQACMGQMFTSNNGVKKVELNMPDGCQYMASTFAQAKNLGEIILFFSTKNIKEYTQAFSGCTALKKIDGVLDFSSATNVQYMFSNCNSLEEMRFEPNTLSLSISLANSSKLTSGSVQSIIDGLATVTTAQTLTFNASVKILQSQVDSANAKGWTVAGGTVVSEEEYYG